jgi:hypothetical protein
MSETLQVLAEDCGCLTQVIYDYLPITQNLIDAYDLSRDPQNTRIYQAFDAAFRSMLANTGAQTYSDRFSIQDDGSGDAVLHYTRPNLVDALEILTVTVEGQGLDIDSASTVTVNTTNGDVDFGAAFPGQIVNILYKKIPTS